jgi:UDPglucose--hexose-1-phosphate uridylyltransferase
MDVKDIVDVVEGWKGIYEKEGEMLRKSGSEAGYVQIFEVSYETDVC